MNSGHQKSHTTLHVVLVVDPWTFFTFRRPGSDLDDLLCDTLTRGSGCPWDRVSQTLGVTFWARGVVLVRIKFLS